MLVALENAGMVFGPSITVLLLLNVLEEEGNIIRTATKRIMRRRLSEIRAGSFNCMVSLKQTIIELHNMMRTYIMLFYVEDVFMPLQTRIDFDGHPRRGLSD